MEAPIPSPRTAVHALLNAACVFLLPFVATGCADLQVLSPDVCGNGTLEPDAGEECDGEASCGAPGTPNACRILCSSAPGTPCDKPGYHCGTDGVCRRPSGSFVELAELPGSSVLDIFPGDVNQDGCHELFVTTRQSVVITAFEGREPGSCPASAQTLPFGRAPEKMLSRSASFLADVTGDGRVDLLRPADAQFGDSLFVHASGATPRVASILYPTVKAREEKVRPLKIGFGEADALLLFIDDPMGGGGEITSVGVAGVVDPQLIPVNLGIGLSGRLDDLVILAAAELGTVPLPAGQQGTPCDACDEVLAGMEGTPVILRISVQIVQNGPVPTMAALPIEPVITLPPGAVLRKNNAAIALVDVDADSSLDVIVNSEKDGLFVAFGTGDGRFHSTSPPDLAAPDGLVSPLPGQPPEVGQKDFTFVAADFDKSVPGPEIMAVPCPNTDVLESSACSSIPGGCEVAVVDVDRDGELDIVSTLSQEAGLVVQRAAGSSGFQVSYVDTRCPAHHLATGDFDNDGVQDVAYFDQTTTSAAASAEEEPTTTLMIAYGNAFAAPEAPQESGLFDDAQGLTAGRFSPEAAGTQLFAARGLGDVMLKSGFALVEGYGERYLFAPFYFPSEGNDGTSFRSVELPAATGGRFLPGEPPGGSRFAVAVVTRDEAAGAPGGMMGSERLWLIEGRDGGSILEASAQVGAAPAACAECVLVAIDALPAGKGDGVDELLLLSGSEASLWSVAPAADGPGSFEEVSSFSTQRSFASVDRTTKPEKHVPRPLVVDLDGDEGLDVALRAADGSMAVLWSSPGGGFEEGELIPAAACGGKCSATFLDIDGDGLRELLAVLPGGVVAYQITSSRALAPFAVPEELLEGGGGGSDFTATVAADLDGDGVEDLVLMKTSTLATVLRAVPVIE